MSAKKEQAIVGLFVLIASGLLLAVVLTLTGVLGSAVANTYTASFKFAGGLEPGATVRINGGPKIGRVELLRIDPLDPQRIEVTFSAASDIPIKKDSQVKITALSALGENYLEVNAGTPGAAAAPPGTRLESKPYFGISDISDMLGDLGPKADALLSELKNRAAELKETITRVNDLLSQQNRANIQASLGEMRGMLEENRPQVRKTLTNIEAASAKVAPLLEDFKKAVADADRTLNNIDAMLLENRPDIREALKRMKTVIASAHELTEQLNRTLVTNSDNIDEMLENMRLTTQNLKQFTDTIKARPASLLRSTAAPDRKPGTPPKP